MSGKRGAAAPKPEREAAPQEESLRQAEARLQCVVDLGADCYWEQDDALRFTLCRTRSSPEIAGCFEPLAGKTMAELCAAPVGDHDWSAQQTMFAERQAFRDLVLPLAVGGVTRFVSFSGQPIFDDRLGFRGYRGIAHDVSVAMRSEHLQQLEHTIARILAETDGVAEALKVVVHSICELQSWAAGAFWGRDEQHGKLRWCGGWGTSATRSIAPGAINGGQSIIGTLRERPSWLPSNGEAVWIPELRTDPRTLSTSVNRGTLREILGAGLDDRIHYGRELAGHEPDAHGVTLRFVDGSSERADVLVGADGVHSAVRRTLLPGATTVDTGSRIIYGRTPLDATTRPLVPPAMHDGFTAVIGGHVGMAAGLVEFRQPPPQAAAAIAPAVRLSAVGDYVMWAVSAQRDRFPEPDAALAGMDATALHAAAGGAIRSWHPDLRALLDNAAVEETFLVRVRSSERVAAWTPSRVTVLGDAIHAMSPARGSGANTALQDAAILCAALTSGSDDVGAAIGGYEERMRDYGFAAVEASRQAESQNARRGNPLWLRILNRLPGSR